MRKIAKCCPAALAALILATPSDGASVEERERAGQAASAEIHLIAGGLERYARVHHAYPRSRGELLDVAAFREALAPSYLERVPETDAWGRPYLYWSNGGHYVIASVGADGELGEWEEALLVVESDSGEALGKVCASRSARRGADLILVDGRFCGPRDWAPAPDTRRASLRLDRELSEREPDVDPLPLARQRE